MPRTPRDQSEEEYLAAARARYRKHTRTPKPVGRPSLAPDTMMFVHIAATRSHGALTQGNLYKATEALFDDIHKTDPDCVATSRNTLHACVRAYLLYRRDPAQLNRFPKHIQRGFTLLPRGIHADVLLGFASIVQPGLTKGPRAEREAGLARRIRSIP